MQQAIQNYLKQLLTMSSQQQLTEQEKSAINAFGIESFIYARLTSKKFRKSRMDETCVKRTKKAIALRVKHNEPIHIVYPQGGYKLWRFPSSPTVDWAEFFTIAYLLEYIAPLAVAYKPGIDITYYLHTLLMEVHDNLTTEEIQAYVHSFEALLSEFRKYLPNNIHISILRDADIYTREEYFTALEEGKKQIEKECQYWSQRQKDDLAKMARLNIKWNGKEDWAKLAENEKQKKIYLASLYEMAAGSKLAKVSKIVKADNNILVFTKGNSMFIGIGSTKASIAKYWVGFGVLQEHHNAYLPIILTPIQYDQAMKIAHQSVAVNIIPQQNFSQIMVFDKPFEFSKQNK